MFSTCLSNESINELMVPENCALNTVIVFEYLRKYHGYTDSELEQIISEASKGIPSKLTNIYTGQIENVSLEHVRNEAYWISNQFSIRLYEVLSNHIQDPDLGYKIGLKSTELSPVKRSALGVSLVGINYVLSKISDQMMKWNRSKDVKITKLSNGHIKVRLTHYPRIIVNNFAMDIHRGLFEAYARLAGYQNVNVEYKRDSNVPGEVYDFNIRFKPAGPLKRLLIYLQTKLPLYDSIVTERDKAIEESDSIQLEMKKQIRNLENVVSISVSFAQIEANRL